MKESEETEVQRNEQIVQGHPFNGYTTQCQTHAFAVSAKIYSILRVGGGFRKDDHIEIQKRKKSKTNHKKEDKRCRKTIRESFS